MQERGIKPKDLSEIAPQKVTDEILNEKRKMTVEQIKGFAKYSIDGICGIDFILQSKAIIDLEKLELTTYSASDTSLLIK
jgi:hypothetical protein